MDEFSFIESIRQKTYQQSSVVKGMGDDAAVFRQTSKDMVTAVDVFVEGVHFTTETMSPFQVGYRALAANLSDMAAMGATPISLLVAVVIPNDWADNKVEKVFKGIKYLANQYKVDLIGGDTVSGSNLTLSITINGVVEKGMARYRSAAKPGDIVFVTGTLGDAQAGLYSLKNNQLEFKDREYFVKRHQMPTPRVHFSDALASVSRLALNDISDGLANEAIEIAEASNISLRLYDQDIPIHDSYVQFPEDLQYKWKYFGGEDFELLGTVSESDWSEVCQAASRTNTKITKIGRVILNEEESNEVYVIQNQFDTIHLKKEGYSHLK